MTRRSTPVAGVNSTPLYACDGRSGRRSLPPMGSVHPSLDSRPRPRDGILRQEADGSVVLLCLESGRYYSLNLVGSRVWELCDGVRTLAEIAGQLAQEFDAPRPVIEADVLSLVGELLGEKLVGQA